MFQIIETIRSEVLDAVREATGSGEVYLRPPDLDPDDMTFPDHCVVLMSDAAESEGLVTVAHVLDFTIWIRMRAPRVDWDRERLQICIEIAEALMESGRWNNLGYLPKLVDPFAEAEIGTAGEDWLEAMMGWQIRATASALSLGVGQGGAVDEDLAEGAIPIG